VLLAWLIACTSPEACSSLTAPVGKQCPDALVCCADPILGGPGCYVDVIGPPCDDPEDVGTAACRIDCGRDLLCARALDTWDVRYCEAAPIPGPTERP
jgi:hypothetical protein